MRPGRYGMRFWMSAAVAVGALALLAAPARATQPVVAGPSRTVVAKPGARVVVVHSPGAGHAAPQVVIHAQSPAQFGPCYPFGCNYRGPNYPFGNQYYRPQVAVAPGYVAPSYAPPAHRRWVAAHWAHQWVPQYYVYQAWVPGYYSSSGWVQGYYEDRTAESGGYYQQVWVDGYWDE